jgi:putative transposase
MIFGHRIELAPNIAQRQYLARSCGTARFAYNWALTRMEEHWQDQKDLPKENRTYLSEGDLRKKLNQIKREQFPWMMEVSKYVIQESIKNLGKAYKNFFAKRAKHPKRRKKFVNDRFSIGNDQVHVVGKRVRLPIIGWIRMREAIRFTGKIKAITVSRQADRWFISFNVEVEDHTLHFEQAENQGEVIGLDAGLHHLAVLSNGEKYEAPKALRKAQKKMRRLQRSLSRRQKGSNGRTRMKVRIARLHLRIANIRKDFTHKLTTKIAQTFNTVCVETLNVKGMMKNRKLAFSLADASMFEMKRQLRYKMPLRGGQLVEADQWFPSSKLCCECGSKNEKLQLKEREWACRECGTVHDRDINAALNLKAYAVSYTVEAPGPKSTGRPKRKPQPVDLVVDEG